MRLEQRLNIKDPVPARVKGRNNYFPIQPRLAYAFALMIIALLAGPKIYDLATHITVSAERGNKIEINLTDGTSVRLNSESSLKYKRNFNSESRIVNLSGEGYFHVVKGDYPFTVNSQYGTVTVLGTKFNVLARNENVEVVVNEGVISFIPKQGKPKTGKVIVKAGHYANTNDPDPQPLPHPEYPGWIHDKLILNKTNLEIVCAKIERKFDVNIELASDQLHDISITGVINAVDLDGVLTTLAILSKRSYRFEKETYIFY
jgi:ferric-dicitrate binding protein FerR (iron transport regulator)